MRAEDIADKLRIMWRDVGTVIPEADCGKPTWTMRTPDEGVNEKGEGPTTYMVSFTQIIQSRIFLVPG